MPRIESILDKYDPYKYEYVFYYRNRDGHHIKRDCVPSYWSTGDPYDHGFDCVWIDLDYAFNNPREQRNYFNNLEHLLASLPELIEKIEIMLHGELIKTFYHVRNPRR